MDPIKMLTQMNAVRNKTEYKKMINKLITLRQQKIHWDVAWMKSHTFLNAELNPYYDEVEKAEQKMAEILEILHEEALAE